MIPKNRRFFLSQRIRRLLPERFQMRMIPSALRIELMRIATIQTGAAYLMTTTNKDSRLKGPELFTSSEMVFVLMTYPMKMEVSRATMGMMTLLLRKSNMSRMDIPMN